VAIRSITRQVQNALVVLLQVDPRQQIAIVLFVLFFVFSLNIAANAVTALLAFSPNWLLVLAPLFVFVAFMLWLVFQRRHLAVPRDPELTSDLGEYPGLVAMLGLFNSHGNPKAEGAAQKPWRIEHLMTAMNAPDPDWSTILDQVDHSNLQPLLQAIRHHDRHHDRHQGLRHVWLITTADVTGPEGATIQAGSHHLAPLVEKIVKQKLADHKAVFHYIDPELIVPPDDIGPTYRAVDFIYQQAIVRAGLKPYQVIADITGARATMTSGMILACAPRGYPLEYTSTIVDPATKTSSQLPVPQRLHVDTREILRHSLEAVNARLEPRSLSGTS
jgi:energy-coupling factor transporter transmembrane protein EcfT